MQTFFKENWIALVVAGAFIISTLLAIRNGYIIDHNHQVQQQAEMVRKYTQSILTDIMHGLDLGVRGYGLTVDEKLLNPYEKAIASAPVIFSKLDSLLAEQQYDRRTDLKKVQAKIGEYISYSNEMIQLARDGQMLDFSEKLKEDRGYAVWLEFESFSAPLLTHQQNLNTEALIAYHTAIRQNLILQVGILLLVLPLLYSFLSRVRKERKKRSRLLTEVDQTDRKFVFDNGEQLGMITEDINTRSMIHVRQASEFIASITDGNYEVGWPGLTDANTGLNKTTLAGNLVRLRDNLKRLRTEDERRNWMNEGIARFSEIVRNHQGQSEELYVNTLSYLVKYVKLQQGTLFLVRKEEGEEVLGLVACYAFDRRKWVEKTIRPGTGLVGQAFLEGETIVLKEVPPSYIKITSGLGHATPQFITIVPMKFDNKVIAISEFAGFTVLEPHQIEFLEKAGEYLASAIATTHTTQAMKELLDAAAEREEQMRQREEELRQNMEELQAIQEEMHRKQNEPRFVH
jgi:CHASE3 domain sensor protein